MFLILQENNKRSCLDTENKHSSSKRRHFVLLVLAYAEAEQQYRHDLNHNGASLDAREKKSDIFRGPKPTPKD